MTKSLYAFIFVTMVALMLTILPSIVHAEDGQADLHAANGDKYIQSITGNDGWTEVNKYDVALYSPDQIMPGVYLQPDFQTVFVNSGKNPPVSNGAVLGLRINVKF